MAVVAAGAPALAARGLALRRRAGAGLGGAGRGRLQHGLDAGGGRGDVVGGLGEGGGEEAFEGDLIRVAVVVGLACDFPEDVALGGVVGRPEDRGGAEKAGHAGLPGGLLGAGGEVVHDGAAVEDGAEVLGPLDVVEGATVLVGVGAVPDSEICVDHASGLHPGICLLGPIGVGLVTRVLGKTRGELEEDTVRDGVFIIVASIEGENLPAETTAAGFIVPA